jgi:protease IV
MSFKPVVHVLSLVLCCLLFTTPALSQVSSLKFSSETDKAVIVPVMTIGSRLVEQPDKLAFLNPNIVTLKSKLDTIKKAKDDPEVQALLVRYQSPGFNLAQAMELRDALVDFKTAGKKVYVSSDYYNILSYTVATAADEVVLPPVGTLNTVGLSFSLYYFKELLAKLGMVASVVNEGKFKDAFDPFVRDEMSEGTQIQMTALAEDLFGIFQENVAEGRDISKEKAWEILTNGPYFSEKALEIGAVDRLEDIQNLKKTIESEIEGTVKFDDEYSAKKKPKQPEFGDFMAMFMGSGAFGKKSKVAEDKIAIVYACGPIVDGRQDTSNPFTSQQLIASDDFIDLLDEVVEDGGLKALVLRVDSPGGSAIASDRILAKLEEIQASGVPVVVSMAYVAASGGYYISTGADYIVAEPTSITGSIGVIGGKITWQETYDKVGISKNVITIGENTQIYSETKPWDEKERATMMELMSDIYDVFVGKVAEGRKMSKEEVLEIAEGRVWTGKSALEVGLVDELGGLDTAIAKARELASASDASVVIYPKELNIMEALEKIMSGEMSVKSLVDVQVGATPWLEMARMLLTEAQFNHFLFLTTQMRDQPKAMMVSPWVMEFK